MDKTKRKEHKRITTNKTKARTLSLSWLNKPVTPHADFEESWERLDCKQHQKRLDTVSRSHGGGGGGDSRMVLYFGKWNDVGLPAAGRSAAMDRTPAHKGRSCLAGQTRDRGAAAGGSADPTGQQPSQQLGCWASICDTELGKQLKYLGTAPPVIALMETSGGPLPTFHPGQANWARGAS